MMLCLAALEAPLLLQLNGSTYGEECVFVANDWHAALTPVLLAAKYRPHGVYRDARTILAIHNLRHQVLCTCVMLVGSTLPPDTSDVAIALLSAHERPAVRAARRSVECWCTVKALCRGCAGPFARPLSAPLRSPCA